MSTLISRLSSNGVLFTSKYFDEIAYTTNKTTPDAVCSGFFNEVDKFQLTGFSGTPASRQTQNSLIVNGYFDEVALYVAPLIADADFLVFRYKFDDGWDLDTRTNLTSPEVGTPVGYCKGSNFIGSNGLEWYRWGGDNTGTGYESAVIYLNNITPLYPNCIIQGVSKAFWYGGRASGNVNLELAAYKGGTMVKNITDWVNQGGVQTGSITKTTNVVTNQSGCLEGDLVATWSYDTANKIFSWLE